MQQSESMSNTCVSPESSPTARWAPFGEKLKPVTGNSAVREREVNIHQVNGWFSLLAVVNL